MNIMIFFKDCSRRNLRSISSTRLQKGKSPSNNKLIYIGENPRKTEKIIQRSTTPERSQTPIFNYFKPEPGAKQAAGCKIKKRITPFNRSSFKKMQNPENHQSTRYFTNLYIEQLVSVPIHERKSNSIVKRSISKSKIPSKIDLLKKHNFQKATMTEVDQDRLIFYCDPFTIEETESICSPIKPKYL